MRLEGADVFLYTPHRVPEGPAVLVHRPPAERHLRPPRAVPLHPAVQLGDEVLGRHAVPAPATEELVLEQAEEALGTGVVAARPLQDMLLTSPAASQIDTQPGQR